MSTPIYGLGYQPIGDITAADIFFPHLALAKKGAQFVNKKVDKYIDEKAGRAAGIVQQRVEGGVRRAVSDTAKGVGTFIAGGLVVGALVGGIYFYRKSRDGR